jgi:hypothetical protein
MRESTAPLLRAAALQGIVRERSEALDAPFPWRRKTVQDVVFILAMVAFFALAAAFVAACERIIGSEEDAHRGAQEAPTPDAPDAKAA